MDPCGIGRHKQVTLFQNQFPICLFRHLFKTMGNRQRRIGPNDRFRAARKCCGTAGLGWDPPVRSSTDLGGLLPFRFMMQIGERGRPAIGLKPTESNGTWRRSFAAKSNGLETN